LQNATNNIAIAGEKKNPLTDVPNKDKSKTLGTETVKVSTRVV